MLLTIFLLFIIVFKLTLKPVIYTFIVRTIVCYVCTELIIISFL